MGSLERNSTQWSGHSSSSNTLFASESGAILKSVTSGSASSLATTPDGIISTSQKDPYPRRDSPFQAALTKFRSRLTGPQLTEFKVASYDGLCQAISRLQVEQENNRTMMNMARIQSFLEAMHQFSKIIEVFLNVSDAVAFVWGPIKFLLLTAGNWADSFEALLEAYEQIGEHLVLLKEYESLFRESPHMLRALELMYIDILEFHVEALNFFTAKGAWRKIFKSVWKNFQTKFRGILKSLELHKDLIQRRADLFMWQKYAEDMEKVKSYVETEIENKKTKQLKSVREWLATGSQAKLFHVQNLEVRQRYPSTGKWILGLEEVDKWLNADVSATPLLWVTGIPGAGKTVLASVIIEECLKKQEYVTSYFYCNFDNSNTNTAVGIVGGLIEQLLDQCPMLLPHCHNRVVTSGETAIRSFTIGKNLLQDFCSTIPEKLFFIIDGLDECDQNARRQILEAFVSMLEQAEIAEPGKLRVMFISQTYNDIKKALYSPTNLVVIPKTISISSAHNRDDIDTYVRDLASQVKQKHSLDDDQAAHIRNLTVVKAQGMFLYAKLVMPNLLAQPTREDLLEEIQSKFPHGLQEAYERIISRVKNTSHPKVWQQAKKLLGWMVCAKRQLTWKEIQVALSIDCVEQSVRYEERRLRDDIHDICGSLVQVTGDRVHLVHSTAKYYITKCTLDINESSVECELASLCLQYLTFEVFLGDEEVDKATLRERALLGHLAFQDYAVAKWSYHLDAFVASGGEFLKLDPEHVKHQLNELSIALDDFMTLYENEEWEQGIIQECRENCKAFQGHSCYESLLTLTSHIYTYQKKGFEARHKVSIKPLGAALERNRALLEELPVKLGGAELDAYNNFYDKQRRFKCPKVTCMYFSSGFKDEKSRKKHVNIHDRPFQCEAAECLATEYGFANSKDLEKHKRLYHPEMNDLDELFKPTATPQPQSKWFCTMCGKTFTRKFHKDNHERSHRGERPHECPECGKSFTRANDMRRHRKTIHEKNNRT